MKEYLREMYNRIMIFDELKFYKKLILLLIIQLLIVFGLLFFARDYIDWNSISKSVKENSKLIIK